MRQRRPIPVPFVVTLLLIGVLVARLVLFVTLQVVVPVVLSVLSVPFGPGLRRAATRVSDAGRSAAGSLDEARLWLLGGAQAEQPSAHAQNHASAGPPPQHVRVDADTTAHAPPTGSAAPPEESTPAANETHKMRR